MLQTIHTTASKLNNLDGIAHKEAVFVLPYIDPELTARLEGVLVRRALASGVLVCVLDEQRFGFMRIANFVFSRSRSKYFGYLAQDAFPGDGWLRSACGTLDKSNAGLLAFNDGRFFGTLAVFGLARRQWLSGIYTNCLFYQGYHSHFGDTEISAIAMGQKQLVFNPGCLMVEVDYEKHRKENNLADAALFQKRAAQGFDGIIEPIQV